MTLGTALALAGAALAIIIAACGSTVGVVRISKAANALLAKDTKHFSKLLILMLLPSSQTIYALVVAFMMLVSLNVLGGQTYAISTNSGLALLFLCLPVAIIGGISAAMQGGVGVTSVSLYSKHNKMLGSSILIISLSEVFALFGFLISMLGLLFWDFSAYATNSEAAQTAACIFQSMTAAVPC